MAELPLATRDEADTGTLRAELAALAPDEAQRRMVDVLKQELATILRLQISSVRADRELSDLGVDSLMAVEMRTALEARLGVDLPMLSLADRPTLNEVAARVLKVVRTQPEGNAQVNECGRLDALVRQHELAEAAE
jgi:acyl carrier protein